MIRLVFLSLLLLAGCSGLDRDNPLDPGSPRFVDLAQLLIGSWGRNDQERNEIYIFKVDGTMQLLDFTCHQSGLGDPVDSDTAPPCYTLIGTYTLDGNELRLHFEEVYNLPGQDAISLPRTDRVVQISIKRNTLTILAGEEPARSYQARQ